jgi:hypothetical protein
MRDLATVTDNVGAGSAPARAPRPPTRAVDPHLRVALEDADTDFRDVFGRVYGASV